MVIKMNIFVIHGSMRKGNTYNLTQLVLKKLRTYENVTIDEISVANLDLPFCLSCHQCFERGEDKCPHFNILHPIAEKIENCDALIVSGVVYSMHLNASMKNLIDHLSYYFHRPRLFEKKALVITTTAGAGDKTVAKYLQSTLAHWGISGSSRLNIKIQTVPFSLNEKQSKKLDKVTANFYNTIKNNILSSPSTNALIVHNSFRGMSAADVPISEYDKAYWQNSGLYNKVYPQKVNFLKSVLGTIVYKLMKKIMSKNYKTK